MGTHDLPVTRPASYGPAAARYNAERELGQYALQLLIATCTEHSMDETALVTDLMCKARALGLLAEAKP